jgi:two-component system chemotaxis sensor kinase CheA
MQVDEEIINDFIDESRDYLLSIEESLLVLESQKAQADDDLVDKVFRGIHTIKGSSAFLNFNTITKLTHTMETLLEKMREKEIKPDSHIIDALLKSTDLLKQMIDDVHNSDSFDIQELLQMLLDFSTDNADNPSEKLLELSDKNKDQFSENEIKDNNHNQQSSDSLSDKYCYNIYFDLKELYKKENITPVELFHDLQSMGTIVDAHLKSSATHVDQDFNEADLRLSLVYETPMEKDMVMTMFMIAQDAISNHENNAAHSQNESSGHEKKASLSQIQQNLSKIIHHTSDNNPTSIPETKKKSIPEQSKHLSKKSPANESLEQINENLPSQSTEKKITKSKEQKSAQESSSIRISVNILDTLMSLASELVLVRNRLLMQSANTDSVISDIAQELDVVTSEMQETVMQTRMQPLGNVLNKMPRIVRDLARRFHKNIDIHISGNDVELDKNILETLSAPLVHIIRNACDHGIEMPEKRFASGKSKTGLIQVNAYHQAGLIHIDISDDGKGLDPSMIRAKALEKGIITRTDLDQLNDKDVFSLIMTPGFSTAVEMSDISGRGVGMDVVKTAISQIGGVIEIDSEPGKGIQLNMSLPLTLAIIPCLIVISSNERFAIPQVNMDEMVRIYPGTDYAIEKSGDQEVYRLRNYLLPIVRLNELLKRPVRFTHQDRAEITESHASTRNATQSVLFAVVKTGSRRFGLIIDKMTGTEEIVVNPLPNTIKNLQIYQGTTIMGDGEVAMVLDVDGISRHVGVEFNRHVENDHVLVSQNMAGSNTERILTFQYGPKEQYAIPLILVRRLTQIDDHQIEKVGKNDDREFVVINGEPVFIVRLDRVMDVSTCEPQKQYYLCLFKKSGAPFGILFTNLLGVTEMPEMVQEENYNLNCVFGCTIVNDHLTLLLDINELFSVDENKWFSDDKHVLTTAKEKILLVEDTAFFSRLIRNFLESSGYEVVTAENGMEALSLLESNPVDLIVSDIEMPVMDGWRLIQTIRNHPKYKHIPAMALSALNSLESIEKSKKLGFDVHEVKIDKDRMISSVKTLLHNKRKIV